MDLGIQQLIAQLSDPAAKQQLADKLLAQNPNMDPTPLVAEFAAHGTGLPSVGLPSPDLGQGVPGVTPPGPLPGLGGGPAPVPGMGSVGLLMGAQSMLQPPKPQYVSPGAPKVGGAQPAQATLKIPGPSDNLSFGRLMGGRTRA